MTWLSSILCPSSEILPREQVLEDDNILPSPNLGAFQDVCKLALTILSRILPKESLPREILPELSIAIIAQSDQADLWTTPESRKLASQMLSSYKAQLTTPEILIDHILKNTVKARFSTSSQSTAHRNITSDGRKALRPSTNRSPALLPSAPNWRHDYPETTTLLHWAILNLDSSQIEPAWHLLIPPILTLLDDYYPPSKTRGCNILTALLKVLGQEKISRGGNSLLTRTGLGPVMWDAVIPSLLALPPLTPQLHSIPLLHASYETLLYLSRSMTVNKPTQKEKAKLLDKVIRDGILNGMRFAGERVYVAQTLMVELSIVIEEMGIWAVRHLKEILQLLADILSNPFGTTFTPLLLEAVKTLKTVVRVCWVRITPYVPEVLRGLTICWRRIAEEEEQKGVVTGTEEVKLELREAIKVLRAAVKDDTDGTGDRIAVLEEEVITADSRLAGLFAV